MYEDATLHCSSSFSTDSGTKKYPLKNIRMQIVVLLGNSKRQNSALYRYINRLDNTCLHASDCISGNGADTRYMGTGHKFWLHIPFTIRYWIALLNYTRHISSWGCHFHASVLYRIVLHDYTCLLTNKLATCVSSHVSDCWPMRFVIQKKLPFTILNEDLDVNIT